MHMKISNTELKIHTDNDGVSGWVGGGSCLASLGYWFFTMWWGWYGGGGGAEAMEREVRTLEREVRTLEREVHTKCRGYQDTCRFRFRENGILEFTYITDFVTLHSKLKISKSLVSYPPPRRRRRRRMGGVVVGGGDGDRGRDEGGRERRVGGGGRWRVKQVEIT